ncbi:phosphate uptake regulator PhoU [Lentibacillus sp. N15]|uniref:phosphate signaling complex PhoU family protein n=1 Tax=Lentibacillus songyuanensis TaxID=3136161 RepID=UPI0031BB5D04
MLIRDNYYDHKRGQIQQLVLEVLDNLQQMMEHFDTYLVKPTNDNKAFILENEDYIDSNEKKVEKYILEIISLEQLDTSAIKWLFAMSRIIRELERVGDQLTNIITISDVIDTNILRPMIRSFFDYEKDMMTWLTAGIQDDNAEKLHDVMSHDAYVNHLNKETYQDLVDLINEDEQLTESRLKMVIISRFLERIGDHLVNAARTYKDAIEVYQ